MQKRTLTLGVGLVVLALFAPAAVASNIYVTNTDDSGPGSLRNCPTTRPDTAAACLTTAR
jgi:hypothetical protein